MKSKIQTDDLKETLPMNVSFHLRGKGMSSVTQL